MNLVEKITLGFLALIFVLIIARCSYGISKGVGVFGPTIEQIVVIETKHVDVSGSGDSQQSHYMVGTDIGVFEVDNGILLGVWNADEIYSMLKEGKTYKITTEGNKVVNMFFQSYPYITDAVEIK